MAYDIIVGRNEADRKKFGEKGVVFIGKSYVKMGRTTSLANRLFLDVARTHVILVCGKRGGGKSYTLGSICEGIANLPDEVAQNISVVIFDTMGIYWTMKFPNDKDADLLRAWGLKPEGLTNIEIYMPEGHYEKSLQDGIPVDHSFSINPIELTAEDWVLSFGIDKSSSVSIAIQKILNEFKERGIDDYAIVDMIRFLEADDEIDQKTKNETKNYFNAAKTWGLFNENATKITDMIQPGKVAIVDLSAYTAGAGGWGVKNLVTGLLTKKLFIERTVNRKKEEIDHISSGYSYLGLSEESKKDKKPMVWLVIDEAHEFLPDKGKTAATDALVTILREGRQPGVSLILATQQPGKIHKDVMTQSDLVISHRLTAKPDVEALGSMMQSYVHMDLLTHLNNLPHEKGAALILDDNSERVYPIRMRPRFSWHGGEAPVALEYKKKLDLGLEEYHEED